MTTLPLNVPIRLPGRPTSSTAMAIPSPATAAASSQSSGAQMTGADVWRVIRSHAWLIALMVVLSAVGGYGANSWLKKYHSRFKATGALIIVDPINFDPTKTQNSTDPIALNVISKTIQQSLGNNPVLIGDVLQDANSPIRDTSWYHNFSNLQDAKLDLSENFEVVGTLDTRLVYVSMTCSDPSSSKAIVIAITDQYIKNEKKKSLDRSQERNKTLENRKDLAESELTILRGQIAELEGELNAGGLTGTMNRLSQKDIQLSTDLEGIAKDQFEADDAEDTFNTIKAKIEADQDPPEVTLAINQDYQLQSDRSIASQLQLAYANALAQGAESRTAKMLETRANDAESKYEKDQEEAKVRLRAIILEQASDKMMKAKRLLEVENKRVNDLKSEMARLTDVMTQLMEKQDLRTYKTARLNALTEQLDQVENLAAKEDYAGVEWQYTPPVPEVPSFPKLGLTMTLAIALGLGLALGIAFLRELMDTTIRSPRDITRVGNLNLLGIISHEDDDRQSAGARLPVVIFEAPHSMMAEQLRQVRTRLQHSSSLDTTRTILITSPSPGDGKTTIACNLASGLALNGRRILLVDANFRRPELHRIFNLANEQGFSDVLNNLDMFEHSVQETQVPNLYILPSGPKPTNATELLESQLLMDFIERALEEFDHVIFDSGPLLFVSETVALAPRVDGVLTVVRARENTRGVLTRLRDTLKQIRAEHLGVVLNAVRSQGGGYYGRNIRTYYQYQDGPGSAQ